MTSSSPRSRTEFERPKAGRSYFSSSYFRINASDSDPSTTTTSTSMSTPTSVPSPSDPASDPQTADPSGSSVDSGGLDTNGKVGVGIGVGLAVPALALAGATALQVQGQQQYPQFPAGAQYGAGTAGYPDRTSTGL